MTSAQKGDKKYHNLQANSVDFVDKEREGETKKIPTFCGRPTLMPPHTITCTLCKHTTHTRHEMIIEGVFDLIVAFS